MTTGTDGARRAGISTWKEASGFANRIFTLQGQFWTALRAGTKLACRRSVSNTNGAHNFSLTHSLTHSFIHPRSAQPLSLADSICLTSLPGSATDNRCLVAQCRAVFPLHLGPSSSFPLLPLPLAEFCPKSQGWAGPRISHGANLLPIMWISCVTKLCSCDCARRRIHACTECLWQCGSQRERRSLSMGSALVYKCIRVCRGCMHCPICSLQEGGYHGELRNFLKGKISHFFKITSTD